ncbi:MAG: Holliday junction branch migration protein RuvA [Patescibacteria group bacterium]|jgi:Holliday junction DNA helicase RuvA
MIGSLRGNIIEVHPTNVLIEVQGVGYMVRGSIPFLASHTTGEECFIYIHDHVREDAHDLFGFTTSEEMHFFEKLISISGVGPKVALAILSIGTMATVRRAVMAGDLTTLTSVPGIGTKTAQKIVLELKGQLVEESDEVGVDREVIEALTSLGYPMSDARAAVKHLDPTVTDAGLRIREALRSLSK